MANNYILYLKYKYHKLHETYTILKKKKSKQKTKMEKIINKLCSCLENI